MTISRDFSNFRRYLSKLDTDIYEQPDDGGHTALANEFINWCQPLLELASGTVLDIGCGQGYGRTIFNKFGLAWTGITLGEDYEYCRKYNLPVHEMDMSFIDYPDNYFEILFARHVLEHSPFPLLTLMEWRRICKGYLLVVVPAPEYYGYGGKNHYSVFTKPQWWTLFTRAGWKIKSEKTITTHSPEFHRNWRSEREREDGIMFPGAPREYEYWYILEKGAERIE